MGTRGFVGFVNNGVEKITYNHFDAYPSGVGTEILAELRSPGADLAWMRERCTELALVEENEKPTKDERAKYAEFADFGVSTGDDWYSLLRENQGSVLKPLTAGVMGDGSYMTTDAGYSEWGYIVDLDTDTFEVFEGRRTGTPAGRFAGREGSPVSLVAVFNLHDLPDDKTFLKACGS